MSRPNLRRILAASTSAALVAITLLAVPVSAGNTRDVFFGSPDTSVDPATGFGEVTYTPTHPGGYTITDILVQNTGSQTLNHANLYGGYAADQAVENPLFPKPTDQSGTTLPSLPDGLAYAQVFAPAGVTCAISGVNGDNRSLSCDIGQLASGASVTISVVVQTSGTAAYSWTTWYGLYLSETNSTGSNQDNFYSIGTVSTASASCTGTNQDANYFLAGSNVDLSTAKNCVQTGQQVAQIKSGNALSGRGGFSSVSIGGDITNQCVAIGYNCYGDAIVADVLDASDVPGGLQWTVTWYGTRSLSGVIHFWDTYDPATHPYDYTPIPFDKKHQCATASQTECWNSTSRSSGSANPLWFTATFVTDHNKVIGGWS